VVGIAAVTAGGIARMRAMASVGVRAGAVRPGAVRPVSG
jgi:hypothetical protein